LNFCLSKCHYLHITYLPLSYKTKNMGQKDEIILININGADRPGVTAALTEILAKNNAVILDIGQADIHDNLSLGILFQSCEGNSGDILKELLFKSYELDVNIRFNPITEQKYRKWVDMQGKNRYIITILGRKLTARQIAGVTRIVAEQGMNIDDIKRLTGRIPLDEDARTPKASVEFSVRGTPRDKELMKAEFMKLSAEQVMDISFQEDSMYRRMRRLICFDMDSTLIETEVIDELAVRAGVGDQVKAITESAMRGEIDFSESFRQRCALLKGLDVSVMQEIAENLPITEGVDRLMRILKKVGFKIAILSGGFTYFGNYLKQKYNIDYVYANELEVEDGKLTGRYVGDIVDGKRKAELLRLIAQVENVDIRQTVAVGDGANDLPMISIAGLGIAFHAKPKVKETAKQSISTIGLDGILYFLGYKDSYLDEQM
jgi:phosphoserine phosphatase